VGAPDIFSFRDIAVLKGGLSAERSVSLDSGKMCAAALRQAGLNVTEIDVRSDIIDQLQKIKIDACFNALHGRWGEDGCIQGALEILKIPYTHSGVLASALAMDKQRSKKIYSQAGLQTPYSKRIIPQDFKEDHNLKRPYVVKPVNEGSSVGIYIVKDDIPFEVQELDAQRSWMAEAYIAGRELTVSVLNNDVLGITEIIPKNDWYDFDAKYALGGSDHVLPAVLPPNITEQVTQMALTAHRALGCHSVSRSDFRYNEQDGLFILETNTQPGMTSTSLLPEQAQVWGLSFQELCLEILRTARLHV